MTQLQTPPQPARSYDRADWQRGYESQKQEFAYSIDDIDGRLPPDLRGTFFRNGPAMLDVGGRPVHHPFDGDGMVWSIALDGEKAFFRNRYVRTEGFLAEQEAGRILYRGVFGTQKPGGWLANIFDLKSKNIANTNVIYWGDRLLALWEGGAPYRLDPRTLETIGTDDLGGILPAGSSLAAHPRVDRDRIVHFSVEPGISSKISIYELDAAGKLDRQFTQIVPGFAFFHDMAITPNYCIFAQNPITLDPLPYALGFLGAAQCLRFQSHKPTKLILIPRRRNGKVRTLETEACFVFHHINAWEEGENLVLDSICYPFFPTVSPQENYKEIDFDRYPPGQVWRFQADLTTEKVACEVLEARGCEFPALHPRCVGYAHRYLYLATTHFPSGNAPLQAIQKIDLKTGEKQVWSFAPRGFASEPVFVPFPNGTEEDEGWLLVSVYDAAHHRTDLAVLDARNPSEGPIATLHLRHHIPYGLHGSFTSQIFAPIA